MKHTRRLPLPRVLCRLQTCACSEAGACPCSEAGAEALHRSRLLRALRRAIHHRRRKRFPEIPDGGLRSTFWCSLKFPQSPFQKRHSFKQLPVAWWMMKLSACSVIVQGYGSDMASQENFWRRFGHAPGQPKTNARFRQETAIFVYKSTDFLVSVVRVSLCL